jgi:hypothetical protein
MTDGEALAEAARTLGPQIVASLFSGRQVAADPWREIAERHSALKVASVRRPLEPEAEAAGILANIICSAELEAAQVLARRIPDPPEFEFFALAANAIICDRLARSNPSIAEPHARLADSLYALMTRYCQNIDNYIAGSLRILSEYIAFFSCTDDVQGKFSEASSLTAGVSHLASKYGIYRYVESTIEIGDRVLAENNATSLDAVGFWTVANNLANLHIALAEDQPPASSHEYDKALACTEAALTAADAATSEDAPSLRQMTLRKLAQLHMSLAIDQADVDEHAAMALRLSEEYVSVAPDRAAATQWAAQISEAVRADHSIDAEYRSRAAALQIEYLLAAERIGEWPHETARRITAAEGPPEQRAQIASEIIATLYEELTAELDRAIAVCGFDWSICKLILALGAIASGRLGELTGELVRSWLTTITAPQDTEPWTPYRVRQYMSMSGESRADRGSVAGRIVELALLAELVESDAPDIRFQGMLRSQNTALLKHIVEGWPLFQELSGPSLSHEEDLDALQRAGQQIFRARFDEPKG